MDFGNYHTDVKMCQWGRVTSMNLYTKKTHEGVMVLTNQICESQAEQCTYEEILWYYSN